MAVLLAVVCAQGIAALLQKGVSEEGYQSECDFYILVFIQDTIMSVASTIALVRSCPRPVRLATDVCPQRTGRGGGVARPR